MGQKMRWIFCGFSSGVALFIWGWGVESLIVDPWLGKQFAPIVFLLGLPNAVLAVFWWARATGRI